MVQLARLKEFEQGGNYQVGPECGNKGKENDKRNGKRYIICLTKLEFAYAPMHKFCVCYFDEACPN